MNPAPSPRRARDAAWLAIILLVSASALAQEAPPATEPRRGFLGVAMAPSPLPGTDPALAAVQVTGIVPGSAAERAGLREGDVLLEMDGSRIAFPPGEALQRFSALVREKPPGTELRLTVRRRILSVQSSLDGQATGPMVDASGAEAKEVLPDLGAVLEANPGKLVEVRARVEERESPVVATLGERPNTSPEPLPPNASLRPDLEAMPLEPGAALAARLIGLAEKDGQPVAATHEQLKARLDEDERVRDPFRLQTVRYLKRDPLRLPGASRALAAELARVVRPGGGRPPSGLAGLVAAARPILDAVAPVDTATVPAGPPQHPRPEFDIATTAAIHADFVVACLELATARIELAFARLDAPQRASLAEQLPVLADTFAGRLYLHEDPDPRRWRKNQAAIALLALVDRGALAGALEALAPLADPAWHAAARADLLAVEAAGLDAGVLEDVTGRFLLRRVTPAGDILFGGSGANDYRYAPLFVLDVDGDDRYLGALAGARPGRPVSALVDLGGDDRYQSTEPFALGAACMGAALLVDARGDDRYTTSASFSQGAALCGTAALVDLAGRDEYRGSVYVQGSGLGQALAALIDSSGDDLRTAGLYAQGFAGPGAFGVLIDGEGDDRYVALGVEPCTYGESGVYHAMSQGSASGFRQVSSGGVGALVDAGGRDRYEAGNFSQGGGYYFAWGLLADLGAQGDAYEVSRYGLGFAAHSALGSMIEGGGDDVYRGTIGAQLSAAWDLSATCLLEDGGDDRYEGGGLFSSGASAHNGFSLLVDRGGKDRHASRPGPSGPNDYHGGPSLSVFIDAGGEDDLAPDLPAGRATVDGATSVRVDLPGSLEAVDDASLRRLLGR